MDITLYYYIIDYIETKKMLPSIDDIEKKSGKSIYTIRRSFKNTFGFTMNEYLKRRSMTQIIKSAKENSDSFQGIKVDPWLRYKDFSQQFKYKFGSSPKEFLSEYNEFLLSSKIDISLLESAETHKYEYFVSHKKVVDKYFYQKSNISYLGLIYSCKNMEIIRGICDYDKNGQEYFLKVIYVHKFKAIKTVDLSKKEIQILLKERDKKKHSTLESEILWHETIGVINQLMIIAQDKKRDLANVRILLYIRQLE